MSPAEYYDALRRKNSGIDKIRKKSRDGSQVAYPRHASLFPEPAHKLPRDISLNQSEATCFVFQLRTYAIIEFNLNLWNHFLSIPKEFTPASDINVAGYRC